MVAASRVDNGSNCVIAAAVFRRALDPLIRGVRPTFIGESGCIGECAGGHQSRPVRRTVDDRSTLLLFVVRDVDLVGDRVHRYRKGLESEGTLAVSLVTPSDDRHIVAGRCS